MREDDFYLGYYLHLVQDVLYRRFVYDKYHWNPMIPGNVERLHRDYAIVNGYIIKKYNLVNDLFNKNIKETTFKRKSFGTVKVDS